MGNSTIPEQQPLATPSTETNVITGDPVTDIIENGTENCCRENMCADSNSHCYNCTCMCNKGFVLKTELTLLTSSFDLNETCVPWEGKLPGQNCTAEKECGGSFYCLENICECPSNCKLRKSDLSCECQSSKFKGSSVAIVMSVLIVMFWCCFYKNRFCCMIERRNRVRRLRQQERDTVRGISTLGGAYGTDHIHIQPGKTQTAYHSPFRNHQTIAPTTPLHPGFNAYGQNQYNAYHSSLIMPHPPSYEGLVMTSLPAYPYHYLSGSYLTLPYADDDSIPASRESQLDLRLPVSSAKYSSSAPSSHVEMVMEGLRVNRSARF
ncbi:uncharacterized protein [Palaemon carinicauda]|uniref:uncharacterized protein n=1 Tax=Palaemon carinicauda TaxID=392227 RepID=UPI0035B64D1F